MRRRECDLLKRPICTRATTALCVLTMGLSFVSKVDAASPQAQLPWYGDVSHAQIPNRPVEGRVGSKQFNISRAQLRTKVNPGKSSKFVSYSTLELTAEEGTPGAEFILGVPPGSTLDGKTLWSRNMMDHSPDVSIDRVNHRGYPAFQAIWLHGARKQEYKLFPVFEMLAVMKYSIHVEFGINKHGKIPGKIYFCGQADPFFKEPESVIVGTFEATLRSSGQATPISKRVSRS